MKALVDRSTLRALARTPGFTIMVIVSLALAVGLTTTTYGIVDAVMHPYVPYRAPEQLYAVQTDAFDVSDDLLADMARSLRAQRQLYSDFAMALAARAHPTIGVAGQTLDVFPQEASVNFFDVLGVRMFAGRGFRPEDRDAPDRAGVVVSYRFWRRYLHGAMPLSSVPVMVDGQAYTVIGVLGPDVRRGDVFLAMPRATEEGWFFGAGPVLRVRSGVTEAQLTAALRLAARQPEPEVRSPARDSL